MQVGKLFSLGILFTFLIAACGGKSNSDPVENVKVATKEPDLQTKVFRSACNVDALRAAISGIATGGDVAIKSAYVQYEFVGANVTHSTHAYQSPDCSGAEAIILNETGSFVILEDQKTADGGKFIDITYDKLTMQTLDANGAAVANNLKMCGAADWVAGAEPRDVTPHAKSLNCHTAELPRKVMDVYKLDGGNTLYFGSRVARIFKDRPEAVETSTPYKAN